MKKGEKSGLSSIVTALILILLVLVSIGVVWVVVRGLIQSGSENVGLGKFMINLEIKGAYAQGNNIISNIRRTGEGELVKIKFILFDGQNSEVITQDANIAELETKSFSLPTQLVPAEITTLSVVPVFLSSDGKEIIGDVTDVYNINVGTTGPGDEGDDGDDGDGGDGCIKDCTGLQCGEDPICREECGPCSGTDTCTNHVCVPENCPPELPETTCDGWVCGEKVNNCGAMISCPPGCVPNIEKCKEGVCEEIHSLNNGVVQETWPGTSGMYFGSSDLPTDVSYEGYYIEFPESAESDCLLVSNYIFPVEGYSKSHIAFNFETSIETGDNYQIWETVDECNA